MVKKEKKTKVMKFVATKQSPPLDQRIYKYAHCVYYEEGGGLRPEMFGWVEMQAHLLDGKGQKAIRPTIRRPEKEKRPQLVEHRHASTCSFRKLEERQSSVETRPALHFPYLQ